MEKTVIVGFSGGYREGRINYNHASGKWTLEIFVATDEDMREPYVLMDEETKVFDNPTEALLWLAKNELGWKS